MPLLSMSRRCLRKGEILSGVPLSREMRKRILAATTPLTRPPCLAVVLVGDRPDSVRYINHKRRAAVECGIEVRLVQLPPTIRQHELHRALAAVNNDVLVDGVILQLPLPPHLRARPALFHIHPGKDVDGLHPLNAGNLFLQDQSPLISAFAHSTAATAAASPDTSLSLDPLQAANHHARGLTEEVLLLATNSGGYNTLRRRTHESKFFVPCCALAIRSLLFSFLSRTEAFAHLLPAVQSSEIAKLDALADVSSATVSSSTTAGAAPSGESAKMPGLARRDLHAVIVNKSMVVGVPTAALLQRAGGFVVTTCSRSNSFEAVRAAARQADVLITAYGQPNVFDASCVKEGAIVIDAAINEVPPLSSAAAAGCAGSETPTTQRVCGDVNVESVASVAAAVTKTPGGVGPLTVTHLMLNVLKAYRLRHANHLYYNNIYTEFLKMYGTYDKVRDYAPAAALPLRAGVPAAAAMEQLQHQQQQQAQLRSEVESSHAADDEAPEDNVDDEDADNESYEV